MSAVFAGHSSTDQTPTPALAANGARTCPRPPYPGLAAFEAEDALVFFGRDAESRAVIERLDRCRSERPARLLAVLGASGAGKSSLLKAGVLPQLARRPHEWLVLPLMRPRGRFYLVTKKWEAVGPLVAETFGHVEVLTVRDYSVLFAEAPRR